LVSKRRQLRFPGQADASRPLSIAQRLLQIPLGRGRRRAGLADLPGLAVEVREPGPGLIQTRPWFYPLDLP
jgi:hypothetical protein